MFQSLVTSHVEPSAWSPAPLVLVSGLTSGNTRIYDATLSLGVARLRFSAPSVVKDSAFVFACQFQDFSSASIASAKLSINLPSGVCPFFFRFEGKTLPSALSHADVTAFPFSGSSDAFTVSHLSDVTNNLYVGIGFYFPDAVSTPVSAFISLSQYASTAPFFQPLK